MDGVADQRGQSAVAGGVTNAAALDLREDPALFGFRATVDLFEVDVFGHEHGPVDTPPFGGCCGGICTGHMFILPRIEQVFESL
jgi:hypothetical protein